MEIGKHCIYDKNVTDVKMSKRDDFLDGSEPESEVEEEPELEEVDLGYTHIPYKKPALSGA